mmetsp:Transcript_12443/g.19597  ORF Transcript_12443/g.19597 Transcript_12443/m.19597 type:complete len:166 (-) Transcript_12443:237-734(-)
MFHVSYEDNDQEYLLPTQIFKCLHQDLRAEVNHRQIKKRIRVLLKEVLGEDLGPVGGREVQKPVAKTPSFSSQAFLPVDQQCISAVVHQANISPPMPRSPSEPQRIHTVDPLLSQGHGSSSFEITNYELPENGLVAEGLDEAALSEQYESMLFYADADLDLGNGM